MYTQRWWILLVVAGIVAWSGHEVAAGEDKLAALERKDVDVIVYRTLKGIIDQGADLYNGGDWAGCHRLYEGALLAIRPLLDHRPALQTAIDKAVLEANRSPRVSDRAFVLRAVIDQVRKETAKAAVKKEPVAEVPVPTVIEKSKEVKVIKPAVTPTPTTPAPEQLPQTKGLWDRLGAERGVARIIDDFINPALKDPGVNFYHDRGFKPRAEMVVALKKNLTDLFSEVSGGPLHYQVDTVIDTSRNTTLTNEEYEALLKHLRAALEQNKVKPEDAKSLLTNLASLRKELMNIRTGKHPVEDDKDKPEPTNLK
jgi:truncated hemoglobin YjbI